MTSELTREIANECLNYDQNTGAFLWKKRSRNWFKSGASMNAWNGRFSGKAAGSRSKNGYLRITISGTSYYCHRLAWLMVMGVWPQDEIHHVNGHPDDNRICNLMTASREENQQSLALRSNNTSGYTGVRWCKLRSKWKASISTGGVTHNIGSFQSKESAAKAYADAKKITHKFQPVLRENHNEGSHLCSGQTNQQN